LDERKFYVSNERKSEQLEMSDTLTAAAMVNKMQLATLDLDHIKRIDGLNVFENIE
jgi:predicted nucleic acid-binding protein